MIEPGKYLVIEASESTLQKQGFGVPNIGDIVIVANRSDTRWKNGSGEWCWAVIDRDIAQYGACFHKSHLLKVED